MKIAITNALAVLTQVTGAVCLFGILSPFAAAVSTLELSMPMPNDAANGVKRPSLIEACINGSCLNPTTTHGYFAVYDADCAQYPVIPFDDYKVRDITRWECVAPSNPNYVFAYSCVVRALIPCFQNDPVAEPMCPSGGCHL